MKRLLIIISMVSCMFADDAAGNWKLSGLTVDYYDIARETKAMILHDAYGFGIEVNVGTIVPGLLFNHTARGPWGDAALQAAGVNLNVNLYPDGTGVVGEGSYYPDVDLIPGTCITQGQIFPITDAFNWESDHGQDGNIFPYVNILGLPSSNALAGQTAYGLGVNGSSVFDNWTSNPQPIPTPSVLPGIFLPDGTILSYPAENLGVTGGAWGGYFIQGENMHNSNMGQTLDIDFVLEWSAIDGWESESGLGDDPLVDEDGDESDYDRIFGIPYISSTYVNNTNPLCDITGGALTGAGTGLNYPIAGDIVTSLGGAGAVGALITGLCVEGTEALCVEAGGAAELVWAGCMDAVVPSVEGLCDAAGTPQAAVAGLCFETSQDPALLATCEYAGVDATVVGACMQLGFDAETCAQAGGIATSGIADACESGVIAGAEAACEGAGGLFNTIYGGCQAAATDACVGAGGVWEAIYGGCIAGGGDAATCAGAADAGFPAGAGMGTEYCADAAATLGDCATVATAAVAGYGDCATWAGASYAGSTCADAGTSDCAVLVSPEFATEMCGFIGYTLTTSETCNEWAWAVADGFAAQSEATGYQTCTEAAEGATGIPMGAGTAYCGAAADALFALQTGVSCSQYGAGYTIPVVDGGLGCIESVAGANDVYLMDPTLVTWGMFLTYNAASVQQYLAAGYTLEAIAAGFPALFVNDSAVDFNPACYADDTITCFGRLVMTFDPTCVAEVEAHQIVAEFVDLGSLDCDGTGDVAGGFDDLPCAPFSGTCSDQDSSSEGICLNEGEVWTWDPNWDGCYCDLDLYGDCATEAGEDAYAQGACVEAYLCYDDIQNPTFEGPAGDGFVNVVDVVKLVGHILGTSPLGGYLLCEADMNGDGVVNVVDVVSMVNTILNSPGLGSDDATEATIVDDGVSVSIDTDGYIGAVDMTVEFNGQFDISLDDKFIGDMLIKGNTAHIVLVGLDKNNFDRRESIEGTIFNYTGEILSISQEIANSSEMINNITFSDGNLPSGYEISNAYPNPFNPSTSFEMRLFESSDVTVKIYNLTGQLVDVIAEGNFTADTHTFTWNAENLASGVYFISTQVGNSIENQKVMLIK